MEKREIIDLHCHILPGLDDGIQEVGESVEACRIAVQDGITGIVATPHYKEGFFEAAPETIRAAISDLKKRLVGEGLQLQIYPGSEVHLTDNIPGKIRNGSILTLNDTQKYILLELPYTQYPVEFEQHIFALQLAGIKPVLAHPERVRYFKDDIGRVAEAVRLGALTQVTSSSIMGIFGEETTNMCFELAAKGLIHIIASDSHDASRRAPRLMDACGAIAKVVGEEGALKMISHNPLAIIRGDEVEETTARQDKREKADEGFSFFRLFTRRS